MDIFQSVVEPPIWKKYIASQIGSSQSPQVLYIENNFTVYSNRKTTSWAQKPVISVGWNHSTYCRGWNNLSWAPFYFRPLKIAPVTLDPGSTGPTTYQPNWQFWAPRAVSKKAAKVMKMSLRIWAAKVMKAIPLLMMMMMMMMMMFMMTTYYSSLWEYHTRFHIKWYVFHGLNVWWQGQRENHPQLLQNQSPHMFLHTSSHPFHTRRLPKQAPQQWAKTVVGAGVGRACHFLYVKLCSRFCRSCVFDYDPCFSNLLEGMKQRIACKIFRRFLRHPRLFLTKTNGTCVLAKWKYFTNLDFPEIRGFPETPANFPS